MAPEPTNPQQDVLVPTTIRVAANAFTDWAAGRARLPFEQERCPVAEAGEHADPVGGRDSRTPRKCQPVQVAVLGVGERRQHSMIGRELPDPERHVTGGVCAGDFAHRQPCGRVTRRGCRPQVASAEDEGRPAPAEKGPDPRGVDHDEVLLQVSANDHPTLVSPEDPLYYAPPSVRNKAEPRSNSMQQMGSDHLLPTPSVSRFDKMHEDAFARFTRPPQSEFVHDRDRPRARLADLHASANANWKADRASP